MTTIPPHVRTAEHVAGLAVRIRFSDGFEREIDLGPWLRELDHPQYAPYMTPEGFAAFVVCDGDLMWGDYDLIFAVEDLYSGSFEAADARAMQEAHRQFALSAGLIS